MPNVISTPVFLQPTLDAIEEKTYFVHATESFPATGQLIAGARELGISSEVYSQLRQTLHFAIGSVIPVAISSGDRTTHPYAVIVPFNALKAQLAEVSFLDSYIIGDLAFDKTMFLVMPEGVVPTQEIRDSNINRVTYNPAIEKISDVTEKVIRQEKGWVSKIEHKDFELNAPVFIEEEGKKTLVDNFNFFNPLLEKYQQLSVGGNDVIFIKGNPDSKLAPVLNRYLSELRSILFGPEDTHQTILTIDYLFDSLKEYLTSYFPPSKVLTVLSEEKNKLYTVADYRLEKRKYISTRNKNIRLEIINAAVSPANLIDFFEKQDLYSLDYQTLSRKVKQDMLINRVPDGFPFSRIFAFIEYCKSKGFSIGQQALDNYFIRSEIIQWGNANNPLEENRLKFCIQQILRDQFDTFFTSTSELSEVMSSALTLPLEKFLLFINFPEVGVILESRKFSIPIRMEELASFRKQFLIPDIFTLFMSFNRDSFKFNSDSRFISLEAKEKIRFLNEMTDQLREKCSGCYALTEGGKSVFKLRQAVLNTLFDSTRSLEETVSIFFAINPKDKQIIIKDHGSKFSRLFTRTVSWHDFIKSYAPTIFELPVLESSHARNRLYPQPANFDEAINYFFDSQRSPQERQGFYQAKLVEQFKTLNAEQVYLHLEELDRQMQSSFNKHLEAALIKRVKPVSSAILDSLDANKFNSVASLYKAKCLPGGFSAIGSGHSRKKREALGSGCKITWKDIDAFNEEKERPRELNKIKVNSEQFLKLLENPALSEVKRVQLLQLAEKVSVTGQAKEQVTALVNHQTRLSYLNKVGHVSDRVMKGMMAKNTVSDFLQGNYEGVAINVGLVGGGVFAEKMASTAANAGAKLAAEGEFALFRSFTSGSRFLVGQSLKLSAPFLARATSVFIVYDLVNQIEAYKQGNSDALVGIVGDSVFLGVDAVVIGISVAEGFGLLEGVASFAGPIGAAIGAVVFVGVDVYLAVKRVNQEDALIHLSSKEKFVEGLRAFVGMGPAQYIKHAIEEKQGNNQLYANAIAFLKNNTQIQRYILPTVKAMEMCRTTRHYKVPCLDSQTDCVQSVEKTCGTQLNLSANSRVFLDDKRNDFKWSRTKPEVTEGRLFCAPMGEDETVSSGGAYLCDNAMGIEYPGSRAGNITLIDLGDGNDRVVGFPQGDHIVKLGSGYKDVRLENGNHVFQLTGEVSGVLESTSRGVTTLDLRLFAQQRNIYLYLDGSSGNVTELLAGNHSEIYSVMDPLSIEGPISNILLRRDKQDYIRASYRTHHIDAGGGRLESQDHITIPEFYPRPYELTVVIRSYTAIINHNAHKDSHFIYTVPSGNKGEAAVNLGRCIGSHRFVLSYTLEDISKLEKVGDVTSFHFAKGTMPEDEAFTLNITYPATDDVIYTLSDSTEIRVGKKGFYALQRTNRSVEDILIAYPNIAERLDLSIFVYALATDESIAIGHGSYDVLSNAPGCRSHLIGNGGENIFKIIPGNEYLDANQLPLPEVVIYDKDKENLVDTLDLRQLIHEFEKDLMLKPKVEISVDDSNDIVLNIVSENYMFMDEKVTIMSIRLKDAWETHWHKRLHVLLHHAPMELDVFDLKPLPLEFSPDKDIIVISPEDVEKYTTLVIPKKSGHYRFTRLDDNLLMSNALASDPLAANERYTLFLKNFYLNSKLRTLLIKFSDKNIALYNEAANIANASDFSVEHEQYRRSLHDRFLNKTLIPPMPSPAHYQSEPQSVDDKASYQLLGVGAAALSTLFIGGGIGVVAVGSLILAKRMLNHHRARVNALPMTVAQAAVVSPLLSATTVETKSIENKVLTHQPQLDYIAHQENHSEQNASSIPRGFADNAVGNFYLLKCVGNFLGWGPAVARAHTAGVILANANNDARGVLDIAEQHVIKAIGDCDIAFGTHELSSTAFFKEKKAFTDKLNHLNGKARRNIPTFFELGSIQASTSNDSCIQVSSIESQYAVK